MSPTQETDPPPPYNRSAQQTVTAADFQVRAEQSLILDTVYCTLYCTVHCTVLYTALYCTVL